VERYWSWSTGIMQKAGVPLTSTRVRGVSVLEYSTVVMAIPRKAPFCHLLLNVLVPGSGHWSRSSLQSTVPQRPLGAGWCGAVKFVAGHARPAIRGATFSISAYQ